MKTTRILWFYLLLPLSLLNFTFTINIVTSQCLGHQQSLLLHLKNGLIFNPAKSKKLIHWNHTDDCCQWKGVACSTKGNVIALDISHEFITGGNLTSLFKLQYLQNLNLAYNEFHFGINSEFKNLKNLRYLNLSNAGFMGQIPTKISHLSKLETLDLSTTFTSSSQHGLKLEKPNIVEFVQNFTRIKELYLDGVAVSAKGEEWCHAVSSLQGLQVLSMSSSNLSGPLDPSLTKFQSLSVLQLDHNNLSSPVPDYFGNLSGLNTLQLRSCGLSRVFPKNILQLPSLQVLDVSDNQGLHGSLTNFPNQASLSHLNLSHTNFSGPIPDSIGNLKHFSTLDLSNCQFNGTLPNSISNLAQLVYLDLSFNNLTGPLPSFNRSKALKTLYLNHNYLNGTLPSTHFEGLTNLVSINLEVNSLHGRFSSSLFSLPSLQLLFLANNRFDGQLDEFPNGFSSSLEMLDLSDNNFQGHIPMSVFQLKRLTLLLLSTNKFNGTIQLSMIQSLQNLTTLDLSHNNLSVIASAIDGNDFPFPKLNSLLLASCNLGIFPSFLRNQSTLVSLDLSSNQIEGIIPNWIWRFEFLINLNLSHNFLTNLEGPFQNLSSNLFHLDLHENQLQGPAPIFAKNINYLDYSSNRFSSITTPAGIGNFIPGAVSIFLSDNSFHGKIDESICNISSLQVLDLSHNGFVGKIPECLTSRRSSSLKLLSLAGNNLNGQISDKFSTCCALRFLDLSGNLLKGTVPKSLANCQNLQVLSVGNNQLMDEFPCFLKKISTISVLVLRSNKFYGQIGCSNVISNWERLQIVDVADNNFSGTLPTTLFQSWKALMSDEDISRFDHLSFDIYDNKISSVNFAAITTILTKTNKMKLAKIVAVEPLFVVEHMLSHVYGEVSSLRRYEASVTIVIKGQKRKLEKILIAFTSLDFSSNHFEGPIPEEIMSFKALHALNLSHNAFSGHIPSTLGNLRNLESLDLSMNSLRGEIPNELASLSFLAIMNLSYNHLVGRIPTGTQIQSFEADSFIGNEGLCGPPLTQNCSGEGGQGLSQPPSSETTNSHSSSSIDWSLLSVELGFTFGFGIFIMPLILWKRWRLWYSKKVDDVLYKIVPQLDFVYERRGGKRYRSLRWKPY
ncbi:receptor-like protein 7 [Arachis hypogaea]|uniref:receptor-like protein 7 n=1 Tax=Arachis hypogaea TaxID=3818 RepID=UPI000DEC7F55|nr:receptor-like protein 7 [Arachis hypogaea]